LTSRCKVGSPKRPRGNQKDGMMSIGVVGAPVERLFSRRGLWPILSMSPTAAECFRVAPASLTSLM
jgi:hypothetical protein